MPIWANCAGAVGDGDVAQERQGRRQEAPQPFRLVFTTGQQCVDLALYLLHEVVIEWRDFVFVEPILEPRLLPDDHIQLQRHVDSDEGNKVDLDDVKKQKTLL